MTHVQSRRGFLVVGLATEAAMMAGPTLAQEIAAGTIRNIISAFKLVDWRDHFESLQSGFVIADPSARVLDF